MTIDRRLRDAYQRSALGVPAHVDPTALSRVVEEAARVRRARRAAMAAVAATLAVVALLLLTLPSHGHEGAPPVTHPTVTSSSSASRTPLTQQFTSPLFGYSIAYPSGWTVTSGMKAWTDPEGDPPSVDVFQSPGKARFLVVSQPLPRGWSALRWERQVDEPGTLARCFPAPGRWKTVTVDGHQGGILGGDYGCFFTKAVVVANGRGYLFTGQAGPTMDFSGSTIFDRTLFDEMVDSISLHSS
ncbi:MAG TPA: hypothetical protein VMI11_11240 [Actinomycetes bacterium]|nr:hypothetical protein [Actinomycetes bacterium]